MNLVFATGNKNKLREASEILVNHNIISPISLGISEDIEETGLTLEDNSLLKARYIFNKTHRCCFADDTGLEVDALGGEPGVMTARFAGENATFDDNMDKLLSVMQAVKERSARFRTVVSLILEDGSEYQFTGSIEGHIGTSKQGKGGFGYDPIFIPNFLPGNVPNNENLSLADISEEDKNSISHRFWAIKAMSDFLKKD